MVPRILLLPAMLAVLVGCDLPTEEQRRAEFDRDNPPPEVGTIERLEHEIEYRLGTSNRDVARVRVADAAGKINVDFAIDDNLSESMIRHGAKMDICEILQAVEDSGVSYDDVLCRGSFPLQDKFGNSREATVVSATYSRGVIEAINWGNFLSENVYDIADRVTFHSTFRESVNPVPRPTATARRTTPPDPEEPVAADPKPAPNAAPKEPANQKPQVEPKTEPEPEPEPEPEAEKDDPAEREKRAGGKLRLADKFYEDGKLPEAKRWYAGIVKDYPGTKAAAAAQKKLDAID